jgi:DNA-3-methyladenine glycosylase II
LAALALTPRGPFDLRQAIGFGFGPTQAGDDDVLRLAFAADGTGEPVGVELHQAERDGPVAGSVHGAEPADVTAQVARILSLDADGAAWASLAARDPVLGGLQARFEGLRPVLFHSPTRPRAGR